MSYCATVDSNRRSEERIKIERGGFFGEVSFVFNARRSANHLFTVSDLSRRGIAIVTTLAIPADIEVDFSLIFEQTVVEGLRGAVRNRSKSHTDNLYRYGLLFDKKTANNSALESLFAQVQRRQRLLRDLCRSYDF